MRSSVISSDGPLSSLSLSTLAGESVEGPIAVDIVRDIGGGDASGIVAGGGGGGGCKD